ncbi:PTH2-domain-containing protein [Atractiella rhizophila]|nr:PTH2-domain-containing protein [Atractiella rhizophila]
MASSSSATLVTTCAAVAVCSGIIGYFIGVGSTLPITRVKNEAESEDEDSGLEGEGDGDLGSVKAGMMEECKLVLVVRDDLKMTKGKIAAQCSHATLACYKSLSASNPSLLRHWERTGQAKIALRCGDEEELLTLQAVAKSLNLCARSIQDAGRTQVAAGSRTVLGIGPAPRKLVDQVTGHLKLL